MNHFAIIDGAMHAEGVALTAIAAAAGTPTYVYSTATLARHAGVFRDAVTDAGNGPPLIAFAVKANPNGAVLAALARAGMGADVVSGGELARAVAAGINPGSIVFSGVGKTADELRQALDCGIFQFNLESEAEAEMLSALALARGVQAPAAFRINPDVDAGTHAKISTGKAENKFGIAADLAPAAYARAARLGGLRMQGVAVHIGSQLTDLAPLKVAFERIGALITTLRSAGHAITIADLGGGLGVPYNPDAPPPPAPDAYGAMVRQVTRDWNVRLVFEPGRLIVANAGILLSRVIRVKPGALHPFVIVDAAMNDLLRPSLYDAWHDIRAVVPRGATITANIVGPVCESGDSFATARPIEHVEAGDLVAFMTTGAYGATMASTYNSRPLAAEVIVDGDRFAIVRPRLDIAALIAAETPPVWHANG